ncbi:TPA: hypothetical protein NJ057_000510 [Vibrio parahaemolyticus]|uniref:hypothetical protein n=1 Tax=Vibrio harveyi group TaxID=717610 RepID=UPI0011229834|nr:MULTISPECIES: hypothetical protein [Vibrio harveyi group]EGQ7845299.1 hypothetical protein [Vibrio alginolyticus]EKA7390033.1 hypothetical protein [Vibrio parahaemolyticus]ELA7334058.1 hypothetical protein [Vibrio parahaemolyticus]ELA8062134.1 hypothetical protein [Vibrio parahaemolyticus]ELB2060707.1 hypothetical protein [Vibrio parahaemolyticus]
MSESTQIKDILGTTLRMSDSQWSNVYQKLDNTTKHQAVVTVALELIKADISSDPSFNLDTHLNKLESYVSRIKAQLDQ